MLKYQKILQKEQSSSKTNVTIAVKDQILEKIREASENAGLSINAKINDILYNYVTFYKHAEKLEAINIPSKIWAAFVELLDEKELLKQVYRANEEVWPSILIHDDIPNNLDDYINYVYKNLLLKAGLYSSIKHRKDNTDHHHIIIEHKFGIKWSRIIAEVFSKELQKLSKTPVTNEILPATVILKI